MEEAGGAGLGLPIFPGRSSTVNDHGFALEDAHQVGGLLTLSHSHLWTEEEPIDHSAMDSNKTKSGFPMEDVTSPITIYKLVLIKDRLMLRKLQPIRQTIKKSFKCDL